MRSIIQSHSMITMRLKCRIQARARGTFCRRKKYKNMHFYNGEIFLAAIHVIPLEINHWLNEVSLELLVCMACFISRDNFSQFDVDKLVRLVEIYDEDFNTADLLLLWGQLKGFYPSCKGEVYNLLDLRNIKMLMQ